MKARWLGPIAALAVTVLSRPVVAGEAKCFPACRSGFLCGPQGQCVSACNPLCGQDQTCSEHAECIDKTPNRAVAPARSPVPSPSVTAPERDVASPPVSDEPPPRFDLTLGIGAQKVFGTNAEWGPTPEAAFTYALNPGRPAEVFLGLRARLNVNAVAPAFGPELGVRGGASSASGFVKGGLFATLRPELVFGHLTRNDFQAAVSAGGSVGPYLDLGALTLRLPVAIQGIYTLDQKGTKQTTALLTVGLEGGFRF